VSQFLYHPFDSPDLIRLPRVLGVMPSAPLLDLFLPLAAALTEKPLKLTAKGNLPTAFCTELAREYQAPHDVYFTDIMAGYTTITEGRFQDLHVMRVVADLAGLVHKRNGKLHITRKAGKLLDDHGPAGIYPVLFETYVRRYNWGYSDRYQPLPFIQQSWAFTCYLLQRFLGFLGLADFTWTQQPRADHKGTLKRRPLLLEAVQFQVR
jgi:hypothetical protein